MSADCKNGIVLQECFSNICKNFNIPAGLNITPPMRDRTFHTMLQVFVDLHSSSCISFYEAEIWKNIIESGIKSKKDYRRLRSLVRTKLIDAVYDLRNLTEESLRNLGVKEFK
jgi:hypothetical protein